MTLADPASPAADPTARESAKEIVAEGARLYARGRFGEAVAQYVTAYRMFPSPKIHYNLALAYQRMGKFALAFTAFDRFVREATDATPVHLADARVALKELSAKVALIGVTCDATDAEAFLDGISIGSPPLSNVPVEAGRHEIVIRSKSLGTRSRAFTAVAGRPLTVEVALHTPEHQVGDRAAGSGVTGRTAGPDSAGSSSGAALPSGPTQAEALIREATDLRRAGKDARAYPLLQKAYEAETTPRTAAQLGLVEMQLGYWIAAEQHLLEALAFPRDPWIASNRKNLDDSLATARSAIGEVVVTGSPRGANVQVNGKLVGNIPLAAAIRIGAGPVRLEVRASGYSTIYRSLTLHGGQRHEVAVALESVAVAAPGGAPSARMSGPPPPIHHAALGEESSIEQSGRGALSRPLAWTAAGLAAGALAFAAYETSLWHAKDEQFARHQAVVSTPGQPTSCGVRERNRGAPGCSLIYSDLEQAKKLAMTGYVAGGLLAGLAATLFIVSSGTWQSGELACAPTLTAMGGTCRLDF